MWPFRHRKTSAERRVENFWRWFEDRRSDFDALEDTGQPFWDEALKQLHRVHKNLRFEVSVAEAGIREFIFTAEGEVEAFPVADALVAQAPEIPGWTFVALKQPRGFDFAFDYEEIDFDPKTMWFGVLRNSSMPNGIGLRVGVPDFARATEQQWFNAVAIILATALGERTVAVDIQHLEVCPLPEDPAASGWLELDKLPKCLELLKREKRNR